MTSGFARKESVLEPQPKGACFGLEAWSRLDFEYLRPGPGRPVQIRSSIAGETLGATERIQTWDAIPGVHAAVHLSRCGPAAFGVESGKFWFRYDEEEKSFTLCGEGDAAFREALLWETPAAVAMTLAGDLVLHAASVDVGGAGILLSGPGMAGKTTLATAFHGSGHRLLSDDISGCRLGPPPVVLPGPALTRLRPDSADHLDTQGLYTAWERPDRIYAAVDPDRRGSAEPVPLKLIVLLEQESRTLGVRRVSPQEALRDLWAMSFWLPLEGSQARCFEGLGKLLAEVPAIRLSRPREWSALPDAIAYVSDQVR